MTASHRIRISSRRPSAARIGRAALLITCVLYGGFAVSVGVTELVESLRTGSSERAVPIAFAPHAIAGGVALVAGAIQFAGTVPANRWRLHQLIGRSYVIAVWVASLSGLWSAFFFEVPVVARIIFAVIAVVWFVATTIAVRLARTPDRAQHREWMLRSFAVSAFFITFEPWVSILESSPLPPTVAYPLAVFLAWFVNAAAVEWWIGRTRSNEDDHLGRVSHVGSTNR